jgi:hypothetical protein
MMTIECIGTPFVYRWPKGEVRLVPGYPVELPDGRAVRLLEKVPGRVRVVEAATKRDGDRTGHIVTWTSPSLWGEMRATVLEDLGHGVRVVHPLSEKECVIPTTWLRSQPTQPFQSIFPDKFENIEIEKNEKEKREEVK